MAYGIREMRDIVLQDYAAWYNRGVNTGIWRQEGIIFMRGPAGCGKTEVVFQIAELIKNGVPQLNIPPLHQAYPPVQLFFNAAMDPESIAGTPAPTTLKLKVPNPLFDKSKPVGSDNLEFIEQTKLALTMHYRQELLEPMRYPPGAILLGDEMGRDAPHMRAAQLKLFSPEKTLSGLDMMNFYIITAGNPADEEHKVDDILSDAAMASGRLIPFDVMPQVDEWVDYMYNRATKEKIPTLNEVANFIIDNPTLFVGRDDENNPNSQFHSPRTWTTAAMKFHEHGGGTDTQIAVFKNRATFAFVSGTVGPVAASAFQAYINNDRPMTVSAILKGQFKLDQHGRLRDVPPPSAVTNLKYHLMHKDLSDIEGQNVSEFTKAVAADIAHSINRENNKIRPKNLMLLTKHGAFSNVVNRVKNLGKFAKKSNTGGNHP